jgi:hypothetical protein
MGKMRNAYKVFVGKAKEKGSIGRSAVGVDWRILLKFNKQNVMRTGSNRLRTGTSGELF